MAVTGCFVAYAESRPVLGEVDAKSRKKLYAVLKMESHMPSYYVILAGYCKS